MVYDRPLVRTREVIEICRMVWRREELVYHGRAYTLPLPPEQGTGLGKPIKMMYPPEAREHSDLSRVAGRSQRRAHGRAGRGLAAHLLPARAG